VSRINVTPTRVAANRDPICVCALIADRLRDSRRQAPIRHDRGPLRRPLQILPTRWAHSVKRAGSSSASSRSKRGPPSPSPDGANAKRRALGQPCLDDQPQADDTGLWGTELGAFPSLPAHATYHASTSSVSSDSGRVLEPPWGHSIDLPSESTGLPRLSTRGRPWPRTERSAIQSDSGR
jgi:hypothetical protein